jgi:aspartyl aminopeptidase
MSHYQSLKNFIDSSTTSIFCADTIEKTLKDLGYSLFDFSKNHPLPKGQKIYIRHHGFIGAFILPKHQILHARYLLSHTDSPCLKLKPQPILKIGQMNLLTCETYGSPLLSSYMGKALKLVGQVAIDSTSGIVTKSIKLDRTFVIPDPAIHLSKESNASLDKGKLHALISVDEDVTLNTLLGIKEQILGHNLYLVPDLSVHEFGGKNKLYMGPRFDNLSSCFAACEALKEAQNQDESLTSVLFFDHEEIGSETCDGAKSHFFKKRLKRIIDAYDPDHMLDIKSMAFSCDVAHANHPSYPDKFDTEHPINLGSGVVIKHHSQHKYAQDLNLFAYARKMCPKSQLFTMRNEVGTGSTLGPYFTSMMSIPTQDIGLGLIGMHSSCEIISENDLNYMIEFLKGFLNGK